MSPDIEKTTDLVGQQAKILETLRQEVNKVLVGQEKILDRISCSVLTTKPDDFVCPISFP